MREMHAEIAAFCRLSVYGETAISALSLDRAKAAAEPVAEMSAKKNCGKNRVKRIVGAQQGAESGVMRAARGTLQQDDTDCRTSRKPCVVFLGGEGALHFLSEIIAGEGLVHQVNSIGKLLLHLAQ